MTLIKKLKDKKVNFEFNKEYIRLVNEKIQNNDALFITNAFKEIHPADAADIIENLNENDREKLIKLSRSFSLKCSIISAASAGCISLKEFDIKSASLLAILSVTTFIYSLLNSKLTFLSLIFLIKVINLSIIQWELLIHNKKNTIFK